jgi:group I intron endonuclease
MVYAGQTCRLKKRDWEHVNKPNSSCYIDRAIKKYGRDQFEFWIADICKTQEEADEYEITMIANLRKRFGKENVYNITLGGGGSPMRGRKHTAESLIKIRMARKGTKAHPNTIRALHKRKGIPTGQARHTIPHTPESRIKCGATNRNKTWKVIAGKRVWMEK